MVVAAAAPTAVAAAATAAEGNCSPGVSQGGPVLPARFFILPAARIRVWLYQLSNQSPDQDPKTAC
jgi:hypothetical protein